MTDERQVTIDDWSPMQSANQELTGTTESDQALELLEQIDKNTSVLPDLVGHRWWGKGEAGAQPAVKQPSISERTSPDPVAVDVSVSVRDAVHVVPPNEAVSDARSHRKPLSGQASRPLTEAGKPAEEVGSQVARPKKVDDQSTQADPAAQSVPASPAPSADPIPSTEGRSQSEEALADRRQKEEQRGFLGKLSGVFEGIKGFTERDKADDLAGADASDAAGSAVVGGGIWEAVKEIKEAGEEVADSKLGHLVFGNADDDAQPVTDATRDPETGRFLSKEERAQRAREKNGKGGLFGRLKRLFSSPGNDEKQTGHIQTEILETHQRTADLQEDQVEVRSTQHKEVIDAIEDNGYKPEQKGLLDTLAGGAGLGDLLGGADGGDVDVPERRRGKRRRLRDLFRRKAGVVDAVKPAGKVAATTTAAATASGAGKSSIGAVAKGALARAAAPLTAIVAGASKFMEVKDDDSLSGTQKAAQVASTGGGALGGALAGAAVGTAVMPVIGTIIGGALGAFGGEKLGETLGEALSGWLGSDEKQTSAPPDPAVSPKSDAERYQEKADRREVAEVHALADERKKAARRATIAPGKTYTMQSATGAAAAASGEASINVLPDLMPNTESIESHSIERVVVAKQEPIDAKKIGVAIAAELRRSPLIVQTAGSGGGVRHYRAAPRAAAPTPQNTGASSPSMHFSDMNLELMSRDVR